MHTSILTLQSQLEKARDRLKEVEENIKKNTGRDVSSQPLNRGGFKRRGVDSSPLEGGVPPKKRFSDGVKGRLGDWGPPTTPVSSRLAGERTVRSAPPLRGRIVSRPFNPRNRDMLKGRLEKADDAQRVSAKKRLGEAPNSTQPTVTVFSRLSGPPREVEDDDKVKVTSQVLVQELPSRKEILAAQSKDTSCKERNKRMFGALMGTLQKFRQEENKLREQEEKRAQVERKVEEAAEREKEEAKKARQELFSSRRQEQINIRHIEFKLIKLKQLAEWETNKQKLLPFIETEAAPKIFYLPKVHNDKTLGLLGQHQASIQRAIEKKRSEVEQLIEENLVPQGEAEEDKEKKEEEEEPMEEDEEEESDKGEESSSSSGSPAPVVKQEPVEEVDVHASDKENHHLPPVVIKQET